MAVFFDLSGTPWTTNPKSLPLFLVTLNSINLENQQFWGHFRKTLKGNWISHCRPGQKITDESNNAHTESLRRKVGECDNLGNRSFKKLPCILGNIGLCSCPRQDVCSEKNEKSSEKKWEKPKHSSLADFYHV